MEIILSKNCESLTGKLEHKTGYAIQKRSGRFFAVRTRSKNIPPDGHWNFIKLCANMAGSLLVADVIVERQELLQALQEAGIKWAYLFGFVRFNTIWEVWHADNINSLVLWWNSTLQNKTFAPDGEDLTTNDQPQTTGNHE